MGNYAILLQYIRHDYERADEYYRRALQADPQNANHLCNYAGFLLTQGKNKEGLEVLDKVVRLPEASEAGTVAAESWFYAFAHRPVEGRDEALRRLKRVLTNGARSPGWDFRPNICRARQDNHPDVLWLDKLAAVISGEADIAILEAWPSWART